MSWWGAISFGGVSHLGVDYVIRHLVDAFCNESKASSRLENEGILKYMATTYIILSGYISGRGSLPSIYCKSGQAYSYKSLPTLHRTADFVCKRPLTCPY